jgi:hypothetical protein
MLGVTAQDRPMAHEQVCTWLQLPLDKWPPDHYTLLGLAPGENDVERIEQRVHERLARLRCYQLHHPDQVTEAMNLLARAFTCLTDREAKKAYDASLAAPAPRTAPPAPAVEATSGPPLDPLAWLFGPWSQGGAPGPSTDATEPLAGDWSTSPPPLRVEAAPTPPELPIAETANGVPAAAPPATVQTAPAPLPADPFDELARSPAGRRGLLTTRDLYFRIRRTRELLYAWDQAGKFLDHPTRRLARSAGAAFLTRQLGLVLERLRSFPPLLGEAGQPGAYVLALARQPLIVPTFRSLLLSQRETLARDWRDGRKLLIAYRCFLRQELHSLRRRSCWGRMRRALSASFRDHPWLGRLLLFLGLAVAAIWLAVWIRAGLVLPAHLW